MTTTADCGRAVSVVSAALLEARLRDGVKDVGTEAKIAVAALVAAGLLLIDGDDYADDCTSDESCDHSTHYSGCPEAPRRERR